MSIVEYNAGTTRRGGVTGRGFMPGVSGNPGGRPKGLARRVRELVGDNGEAIVDYMLSVLLDSKARTADRLDAAKWLADRGFGKAVHPVEVGVTQPDWSQVFAQFEPEDLNLLISIIEKYEARAPGTVPPVAPT